MAANHATIIARTDRAMTDNAHALKITVHLGDWLGVWGIGTTWEEAEQAAHTAAKTAHPSVTASDWRRRRLAAASLFLARDASFTPEQVMELVQRNAISPHLIQIRLQ